MMSYGWCKIKRKILALSPVIFMMFIFVACSMPENEVDRVDVPSDVIQEEDGNTMIAAGEDVVTGSSEDGIIHETSEETVFEDGEVICIESYDYWNDPRGAHPIIEVVHHTYDKSTNAELSLMDVTGMGLEEIADEIRILLKKKYPDLYNDFWVNEEDLYGSYHKYYESIDPSVLDFCLREGGQVDVYDTWMLDYPTNPHGLSVYVTLKSIYH